MHSERLLFDRERPLLLRSRRIQQLEPARVQPRRQLQIVGMVLVSEAQRRQSPVVLHVGIERDAVRLERQRRAVRHDLHRAREVVRYCILETLAPARSTWGQNTSGKTNRRQIESRIDPAAAVEADLLRVELVKIMNDAADRKSLVVVQRLFKYADRNGTRIEHQVFANRSARIREAIRKLLVGRKQQQPRGLCAVRGKYNRFRLLQMHVALGIKVNRPSRASVRIDLNLVYVGIWPNFAAPRLLRHVNHRRQRTRFRSYLAAESKTESAVHASTAPRARLRQNRHRRRKRIPSQFPSRLLQQH